MSARSQRPTPTRSSSPSTAPRPTSAARPSVRAPTRPIRRWAPGSSRLGGVTNVFLTADFVSVTKDDATSWDTLLPQVIQAHRGALRRMSSTTGLILSYALGIIFAIGGLALHAPAGRAPVPVRRALPVMGILLIGGVRASQRAQHSGRSTTPAGMTRPPRPATDRAYFFITTPPSPAETTSQPSAERALIAASSYLSTTYCVGSARFRLEELQRCLDDEEHHERHDQERDDALMNADTTAPKLTSCPLIVKSSPLKSGCPRSAR